MTSDVERQGHRRGFRAVRLGFSKLNGEWMVRLVEPDLTTPGQPEAGETSPPLLRNVFGELDALRVQVPHRGRQVITHEVQRLSGRAVGGVRGELRRWQFEDQPATASVDMGMAEHVGEEGTICFWSAAEHDDVAANDHPPTLRGQPRDTTRGECEPSPVPAPVVCAVASRWAAECLSR